MATPIDALIEGGLPQLKGFQPTPENKNREDYEKWAQFLQEIQKHFDERFSKPKNDDNENGKKS